MNANVVRNENPVGNPIVVLRLPVDFNEIRDDHVYALVEQCGWALPGEHAIATDDENNCDAVVVPSHIKGLVRMRLDMETWR